MQSCARLHLFGNENLLFPLNRDDSETPTEVLLCLSLMGIGHLRAHELPLIGRGELPPCGKSMSLCQYPQALCGLGGVIFVGTQQLPSLEQGW